MLQEKLLAAVADHSCDVVLTTFDLCLRDCEFFTKFAFDTLIVDEAHRLKNSESKLYVCLAKELKFNMKVRTCQRGYRSIPSGPTDWNTCSKRPQ